MELSEKEIKIISVVSEQGGKCPQAKIQKMTKFPRSTLSMALKSLNVKGLINVAKRGKINIITLKERIEPVCP